MHISHDVNEGIDHGRSKGNVQCIGHHDLECVYENTPTAAGTDSTTNRSANVLQPILLVHVLWP